VSGRRVVLLDSHARQVRRRRLEQCCSFQGRDDELIGKLVDRPVVEPDDVVITIGKVRVIVVVRVCVMWLEVPVNRRPNMVCAGVVFVLACHGCGHEQPWHKDQCYQPAAQTAEHRRIMRVDRGEGQFAALRSFLE
jgi:hypothetical protein